MFLNKNLFIALFGVVFGSLASQARADSHALVQTMRSSTISHLFVSQSVSGEYGKCKRENSLPDVTAATENPNTSQLNSDYWKGYGLTTSFGVELMKFIQFDFGHTFINLRHQESAQESLQGSRLHAGSRLVFSSPIGNLQGGLGVLGSRLDYQKELQNADFYGSGYFYSLGLNYFLSYQVSIFGEYVLSHEHLVRNGGSAIVKTVDTYMTEAGIGFSLWL